MQQLLNFLLCVPLLSGTLKLKPCINAVTPDTHGPIVDLGYARYEGVVNTTLNITSFFGLRYAAPPLGELRFRAPQPPLHVSGVQPAVVEPPACLQAPNGASLTNPLLKNTTTAPGTAGIQVTADSNSEDCLFLNVFTPTGITGHLPVVVWIHGGGYIFGNASDFLGSDLVQESNNNVVAVVIQYRLGLFGFLPGQEVKENGALNAGLLDQEFAFRWVNKYIHLFGGDPNKVTIWGESAGGGSVLQHVIANEGKTQPQLFRGAIASSTYLPPQYNYNDRVPELLYSAVVNQTNCSGATDTLACLRATDVNTLEAANVNINEGGFFGTFLFVPVIDGTFIKQRPTLALAQGQLNGQVLYGATNTFEGRIFVSADNPLNASEYARQLFPNFGPKQIAETARYYQGLGTELDQDIAIQSEAIFVCPSYFFLDAFKGRAFKAEYAIPPGDHGDDLAYYFPTGRVATFNNTDFAKAFSHSFLSFVMFLNPNIKYAETITPANWPIYSKGNTEMLFNRTDAGEPVVHTITTDRALLERCSFWHSVAEQTAQ